MLRDGKRVMGEQDPLPNQWSAMAVEIAHRRFNLAEYHAMIEHGILTDRDRVELIAGEIVEMPPIGDPHIGCVAFLNHAFVPKLDGRAVVFVQQPIAIFPDSEPEPDVTVVRYRADFYRTAKAEPQDVLLLVEVGDSSLRFDRFVKLPIYARAGIAEVWVVDLKGSAIEVYTQPAETGYAQRRLAVAGETIKPCAFDDVAIRVSEVLGF